VQSSVEVSLGLSPAAASTETSRCLRCDIRGEHH
jgi:NADPH-dependent glutamate synthase beta subunit-like oxidoreductase